MPETRYCPKCGEPCAWDDRFCSSCRTELRPTTPRSRSGASGPADPLSSMHTELGLPINTVLLNRYQIRKELGAGGMGRVYAADDQKLGIPVAIKVLRDILRQDPGSLKRLISEAKASILLAHPNIVRLHNFEDGEITKFLVMEFVDGETLAHNIARDGKLPEDEVRRIAIEVCKGLEHAHAKKVIHRDLKPGNILLGKDGSVKIADFGIARLCRDSVSRLTSQLDSGTLLYMSPEQLDGESGELSDLYSLGILLYETLSGDPPFFTGEITAQIRYKAPREIPDVSPAMNRIVLKCLEKKPENRFASVRELREELDGSAERRRHEKTETEQRQAQLKTGAEKTFDEGRYADAIALWQQALALKPGDETLTDAIARAQERQLEAEKRETARRKKEEEQAEQKRKTEAVRKQNLESLRARGNEAYNAGKYGDAIALWQEALVLNPGDVSLNEAISTAQADLKKEESERQQAEAAKKNWVESILAQVNALVNQGKYGEAESVLRLALQRDPNNAALTAPLGWCCAKLREVEQKGTIEVSEKPGAKPSRKKLLVFSLIAAAVLLTVIAFVVFEWIDSNSRTYPPTEVSGVKGPVTEVTGSKSPAAEAAGAKEPAYETTGGKGPAAEAVGGSANPPPPPITHIEISVAGRWSYTVTAMDGRMISGIMQISGPNHQLHLVAAAAYPTLGPDRLIHQFREQDDFVGRLSGRNLEAQCFSATCILDGYRVPPQGLPFRLNLTVSPGERYMQGQVVNAMGNVGTVLAQRQY